MAEKVYFQPKPKNTKRLETSSTRAGLHDQLCSMSPAQFNWIIFYLKIPKTQLPLPSEPQASRAEAVLRYIEKKGPSGMQKLALALQKTPTTFPDANLEEESGPAWFKIIVVLLLLGVVGFGIKTLLDGGGSEPRCGDGIVQSGEQCDSGNPAGTVSCNADCTLPPKTPDTQVVIKASPSPSPSVEPTPPVEPSPSPSAVTPSTPPETSPELSPDLVVYFKSGSDVFYPDSFTVLDTVVSLLQENPDLTLRLEGHTDSDGSTTKNFRLSKQRADVVKTYLTTRGVDAARLETEGCGVIVPIANNNTKDGQKSNRRVEFVDLSKNESPCQPRKK